MAAGGDDPPIAKAVALRAKRIMTADLLWRFFTNVVKGLSVIALWAFHLNANVECGFASDFVGYEVGVTQNAPHLLES